MKSDPYVRLNALHAPAYTFAFQPIVDLERGYAFAYEALIRGVEGASASQVLDAVPAGAMHRLDHEARLRAVTLAARPALKTRISLNVLPGSLEATPESLDVLLETTQRVGLTAGQLLLEITEGEAIRHPKASSSF